MALGKMAIGLMAYGNLVIGMKAIGMEGSGKRDTRALTNLCILIHHQLTTKQVSNGKRRTKANYRSVYERLYGSSTKV
jgi:hypothetical protein